VYIELHHKLRLARCTGYVNSDKSRCFFGMDLCWKIAELPDAGALARAGRAV
jgi:hypothetical protein